MSAGLLARLALRAYPAGARDERGPEMHGTLADIRATDPRRYPRELADLVRLGLRARAAQRSGAGRLLADGLCTGAAMVLLFELADLVSHRMRGLDDVLFSPAMTIPLVLIIAAALAGFDRVAGVAGIAWMLVRMPALYAAKASITGVLPSLVPLACLAVMAVAPRHRARSGWRIGWLGVPVALIAAFGPSDPSDAVRIALALSALAFVVTALAVAPADPRLCVACTVPAAYLGAQVVWKDPAPIGASVVLLGALPAVALYVIVRTRPKRRGISI